MRLNIKSSINLSPAQGAYLVDGQPPPDAVNMVRMPTSQTAHRFVLLHLLAANAAGLFCLSILFTPFPLMLLQEFLQLIFG